MQRNRHFSKKNTHVSHKITTFLWNLPLSTIRDLNLEFSNLFKELTNTYRKSMTSIKDSRSDPLILSTKRPLHFWSLIGMSISEAPKATFSNVCSEIVTFSEIVRSSLHTVENSAFGASEFDTPIEDQKWSGRFVERICGSGRVSSIGMPAWESMDFHRKVVTLRDTFLHFLQKWRFRCIHSKIHFLGSQDSTSLSRMRNGVAVSSREFEGHIAYPRIWGWDRGSSIGVPAWESMDFHRKVVILRDTFVNYLHKWWFLCIHSKILPLGLQKSTPLSRIRHGVAVSSREFEHQITDPGWGCKLENLWIVLEK